MKKEIILIILMLIIPTVNAMNLGDTGFNYYHFGNGTVTPILWFNQSGNDTLLYVDENGLTVYNNTVDNTWFRINGNSTGGGGGATTEAELESDLTDVTNVYTNNDFADNSANWNNAYTWSNSLYNTIGLKDLTSSEVDQLENIGTSTISSQQWSWLGTDDQGVKTSDTVTFNKVNIQNKGSIWWDSGGNNLTIDSVDNIIFITDSDSGQVVTFEMDINGIWTSRYQSGARARLNEFQVVPNNVWTKLQLTVLDYDQNNDFDTINNRFIVAKDGIYQISYSAHTEGYLGGCTLQSMIYINGVQAGGYEVENDINELFGETANSGADIQHLTTNDFVELWVWHNVFPALTFPATIYTNYLSVHKIS